MEAKHVSVLLPECIDSLNIRPEGVYVDGTLGMGGHSEEIAKRLTTGKLIGIDRDETAIRRAGERLRPYGDRVQLVHGNFRDTAEILDDLGVRGFTKWELTMGRGSFDGEPHYGTHAWPSMNSSMLMIVEDEKVAPLLDAFRKLDSQTKMQGSRAFVWNIEQMM